MDSDYPTHPDLVVLLHVGGHLDVVRPRDDRLERVLVALSELELALGPRNLGRQIYPPLRGGPSASPPDGAASPGATHLDGQVRDETATNRLGQAAGGCRWRLAEDLDRHLALWLEERPHRRLLARQELPLSPVVDLQEGYAQEAPSIASP